MGVKHRPAHAEAVNVSTRRAVNEDREFLYELHRASLGDAIEATWGPWDDARQREFHDARFQPDRLSVIVCDERDVGVFDVDRRDDRTLYLARMELLPAFQNLGIGTYLLGQLVDDARRGGAAAVELDVLQANHGARRLYERLGFEVVSTSPPKHRMRLLV